MNRRQSIEDALYCISDDVLLFDGMDEALVGWTQPMNMPVLGVYDYNLLVDVVQRDCGGTWDDAAEYVDFNIVGAYVGEHTPIVVNRFSWIDVVIR